MSKRKIKGEEPDLSYWESLGWLIEKSIGSDGRWSAEKQFADMPNKFRVEHIETFEELEKLMQTAEEEYTKNSDGEKGLAVVKTQAGISVFTGEETVILGDEDENVIDAKLEETEPDKLKPPRIFETLKVVLTKDQKEQKTSELLQIMNTKDETVSRFESVKKSHQAEIKDYEKDIYRLRNVVDTGAEWRDVECEQKFDYARGIVDIFRIDTGFYVRSRQMKDSERQAALFS